MNIVTFRNTKKTILTFILSLTIIVNTVPIFAYENSSNDPPTTNIELNTSTVDEGTTTSGNDDCTIVEKENSSNKEDDNAIDKNIDNDSFTNPPVDKTEDNQLSDKNNVNEPIDSITDSNAISNDNSTNDILSNSSHELIATLNNSYDGIDIVLKNFNPEIQRTTWFAIWSDDGGQDDLLWIKANRNSDGSYSYQENLKKHNSLGIYHIHAYDSYNNQLNYISATTVQIDKPEGYLSVTDHGNGSFRVDYTITNHAQLIKDAPVAVWSRDDKSDLIWYYPTKTDNSHYYIELDIDKHIGNIGKYHFAGYVTTKSGVFTSVSYYETNINISIEESNLSASLDSSNNYINIILKNYFSYKQRTIWFAIWSDDSGQDDLVWIKANRNSDGSYSYQENLKKHNSLGIYHIHAYDSYNNQLNYISATTVQIDKPEGYLSVTDHGNGSFRVDYTITNHAQLIKDAPVAVWSRDDKSDLIWYYPTKTDDSHYYIELDIDKHMGNIGKYHFAGYVTTKSGVFIGISYLEKIISLELGELQTSINSNETVVTINLNNQSLGSKGNKLFYAVWSLEGGQNDLFWYLANKNNNGYSADVIISNHKSLGIYRVDAYIQNPNGNLSFINRTEFNISMVPTVTSTVNNPSTRNGTFELIISVNNPANLEKIQVAVWKDANQNDLTWYNAIKVDAYKYKITVDIKNHRFHYGNFVYHTYATLANGIFTNIGSSNYNFTVIDYVSVNRVSQGNYQAIIVNPSNRTPSKVQLATWSEINGQDDIIWYNAINQGNNTWATNIYTSHHKNSGTFIAHIYCEIDGNLSFINSLSYYIPQADFLSGIDLKAQSYSSDTDYLILASLSEHKVNVYRGSYMNWIKVKEYQSTVGAPSTPTVKGDFKIYRKGRYFDSGNSRCFYYSAFYGAYYFHSVLYYKDNEPLRIQDGRLGMNLSHGCIRLNVDNAKWIYDNCPIGTRVIVY